MVSLGRLYGINNSGDIWWLVSDQSIKTDQRGKVCVCARECAYVCVRYKCFYISNFFSHTVLYTQTHVHLATDGPNMFDRRTLLFVPWVFQPVQFLRCSQSDYVIQLLLRSFVLIQSFPKGFWVNVCVCVPTVPLSFSYFVSVTLFFSAYLFFSLPLLACCLPTAKKHMQTHTSAPTHRGCIF